MTERSPTPSTLKNVRLLLWTLVAIALAGAAAFVLISGRQGNESKPATAQSSFGGPFTLVGADAKTFSSARLTGKPYALYFGFTRCGDVCPTTLSRLVQLRKQAGGEDKFNIVFITIDPKNDGPKEVGQYAGLFNSPIIGLTGSQAQIDKVKKQYGIFAEPSPHPMPGKEMEHTATVLLFDRNGTFAGTITSTDKNADAVAKLRKLVG